MNIVYILLILIIIVGILLSASNNMYQKVGGAQKSDLTPAEENEVHKLKVEIFKPLEFEDIPTHLPYIHRKFSKNIHNGQRKLLMNEVYFLTKYGDLAHNVVYAGAAGGHHIPFLSELFPNHNFFLWDPAPFAITTQDRIEINNDFFTDDVAKSYHDRFPGTTVDDSVLFISDIRSGSNDMKFEEFEAEVHKNNLMQKHWLELMHPKKAMLKFRVPYNFKCEAGVFGNENPCTSELYEYLDGEVDIQPWAPPFSGETRLITDGGTKKYENYENKMHYINTIVRPFAKYKFQLNPADAKTVPDISNSFDCAYEIYIWNLYAEKFKNDETISQWIAKTMNHVSKILHRGLKTTFISKNRREKLNKIE